MRGPGTVAAGIVCGITAALCWGGGFVGTRHGLDVGFSPIDLALHRYVWFGLAMLPSVLRRGIKKPFGVTWSRGFLLAILGGPVFTVMGYLALVRVPLGHAGIIQPSCAMLGGIVLATVMLGEKLPLARVLGAVVIVSGLFVVGAEALLRSGVHGATIDLVFVLTGGMFALFGTLLRRWQIGAIPAVVVISILSLLVVPIHWLTGGVAHMISLGWRENLLQIAVQGLLMGVGASYLYVQSLSLLGAGRAAVFPALVPPSVLLVAWLVLGQVPTALQVTGLGIILFGFSLAQLRARARAPAATGTAV